MNEPFFGFATQDSNIYYFNHEQRKGLIEKPDHFLTIKDYYKLKNANSYSYNPLTKEFTLNSISNMNENILQLRDVISRFTFKNIFPDLIVKPIIDPFLHKNSISEKDKKDIALFKKHSKRYYFNIFERDYVVTTPELELELKIARCIRPTIQRVIHFKPITSVVIYLNSFLKSRSSTDIKAGSRLFERGFFVNKDNKGKLELLQGKNFFCVWAEK
jgi:hypothetical protein